MGLITKGPSLTRPPSLELARARVLLYRCHNFPFIVILLSYFKDDAAVVEEKQEATPEAAPAAEEVATPAAEEPKAEEAAAPVEEAVASEVETQPAQPVSLIPRILVF